MQWVIFLCSFYTSFADTATPIMEGSFNNTTALPPQEVCQPLTAEEEELYQELASRISWWFEGLLQCCVGSIGFLANVTLTFPPFPLLSIQNFSSKSAAAEAAKELHKAAARLSVCHSRRFDTNCKSAHFARSFRTFRTLSGLGRPSSGDGSSVRIT